jgi:hypothetical protein
MDTSDARQMWRLEEASATRRYLRGLRWGNPTPRALDDGVCCYARAPETNAGTGRRGRRRIRLQATRPAAQAAAGGHGLA